MEIVTPRKGTLKMMVVTTGTTAVRLCPANPNRKTAVFQNQGSGTVFLGPATVAASGASAGYSLAAGQSLTDNATAGEWWAIGAGAGSVLVMDVA